MKATGFLHALYATSYIPPRINKNIELAASNVVRNILT